MQHVLSFKRSSSAKIFVIKDTKDMYLLFHGIHILILPFLFPCYSSVWVITKTELSASFYLCTSQTYLLFKSHLN